MWFWYIVAALWMLDVIRIRTRLAAIHALEPSQDPVPDELAFVTTPGVVLDDATRRAAATYARSRNLQLLDIIPADVPALEAIGISQIVDPKSYRENRVGRGHTSGYAMLVTRDLLRRAQVNAAVVSPVDFVDLATRLKRYALNRADLCVSPTLKASANSHFNDWPVFERALGGMANSMFMLRGIMLAIIVVGLIVSPAAGITALAAFHLQILLGIAGLAFHPRDLFTVFLLRSPIEGWLWLKSVAARVSQKDPAADRIAALRPRYLASIAKGLDRFFQQRREDCPLCGSRDLSVRLRTTDLIQGKPGRFHLDQCRGCGHIFQNPQLSLEGLNFYYGDFYDGLGGGFSETMFRGRPGLYLDRARAIEKFGKPRRWLDVGTGQAHFCCAAKEAWPEAEFDGLDIGEGVDEALRAGWIQRCYRGFLPDVAAQIERNYDVVSLFHCLEHTPDPYAELDAAYTALSPGGLLVIEVPDPECVLGKLFGRFWLPWFQPQHLHILSVKNLKRLLVQRGFEPLLTQRTEAHLRIDMFCLIMMIFGWLGPKPDVPWKPAPSWLSRLRYFVVWRLGFPIIPLFWLFDFGAGPLFRRLGVSNTYRVVARRLETGEQVTGALSTSALATAAQASK